VEEVSDADEREQRKWGRIVHEERRARGVAWVGMRLIYWGALGLFLLVLLSPLLFVVAGALMSQVRMPQEASSKTNVTQYLFRQPEAQPVLVLALCVGVFHLLSLLALVLGKFLACWMPRRAKVRGSIRASFFFEFLALSMFLASWVLAVLAVREDSERQVALLFNGMAGASWLSLLLTLISFLCLLRFLRGTARYLEQRKLADEPDNILALFWFLIVAAAVLFGGLLFFVLALVLPIFISLVFLAAALKWGLLIGLVAGSLGWVLLFLKLWLRLLRLLRALGRVLAEKAAV
jgi:hypothetical protein